MHLHKCGTKLTVIRSAYSNADAIYLPSSETAHLYVLGSCPGAAGCCRHWTSWRCLSGYAKPSLSACKLPWGWRSWSGMPAAPLPWDSCGWLPDTLLGAKACCYPLMSHCCHAVRGLLPYRECCTLLYKYNTRHLCLSLPNSALSRH